MPTIRHLYDALIYSLAVIAGVTLVAVVLMIIINTIGRSSGLYILNWVSPISEYSLQFSTMLVSPLVLRKKGHIFMVILHDVLPFAIAKALEKLVYFFCIFLCWGLTYFAIRAALHAVAHHAIDMRSIDIPGWVLYFSLIIGFGLMGVEFSIYLFGNESMFSTESSKKGL